MGDRDAGKQQHNRDNPFLRHPAKIKRSAPKNAHVVQGDVLNMEQLNHAMDGQDIVYANLTGATLISKGQTS
jgi:putative NADH-flavin reductase